jgi:hypothetical protein
MSADLLFHYSNSIIGASEFELRSDPTLNGRLVLASEGALSISYAPFDYITPLAKVVIVGITPGAQQAANALTEARRQLLAGGTAEAALKAAKVFASFSGPMRTNLVAMLDYIGLNKWIGINSCSNLWSNSAELVHFTSALRYPVFVGGKNYSGNPSMSRTTILRDLVITRLGEEAAMLTDAIWVPLGPKAEEGLNLLTTANLVPKERVLAGLPHPSGANAERIAYFLDRKPREQLSAKTSADAIDRARERLANQIAQLC